ncbi:hypothetical protein FB451DRAFT_354844 [Mycena latifolia]|nr:hypothetical protein FB451DRAFT_354844 [Mycena latifolia]
MALPIPLTPRGLHAPIPSLASLYSSGTSAGTSTSDPGTVTSDPGTTTSNPGTATSDPGSSETQPGPPEGGRSTLSQPTSDSLLRTSGTGSLAPTSASSDAATHNGITTSSQVASPGASMTALSMTSPRMTVPSMTNSSIPGNGFKTSDKGSGRIAVIAGSVGAVGLLVGALLLVLWYKRRRRRRHIEHSLLPRQYVGVIQEIPASEKAVAPTLPSIQSESGSKPLTGTSSQADLIRAPTEDEAPADVDMEVGRHGDETLNERVRRVEAQLESLLTVGLHVSAPPSYYTE